METQAYCNIERKSLDQDPERAREVAEILKALAHPIRLRIIALLARGPLHVNAIADQLGYKQAVVSQQLRILRMRTLVQGNWVNGYAHYQLAEPRLRELLHCMEGCA